MYIKLRLLPLLAVAWILLGSFNPLIMTLTEIISLMCFLLSFLLFLFHSILYFSFWGMESVSNNWSLFSYLFLKTWSKNLNIQNKNSVCCLIRTKWLIKKNLVQHNMFETFKDIKLSLLRFLIRPDYSCKIDTH